MYKRQYQCGDTINDILYVSFEDLRDGVVECRYVVQENYSEGDFAASVVDLLDLEHHKKKAAAKAKKEEAREQQRLNVAALISANREEERIREEAYRLENEKAEYLRLKEIYG